MLLRPLIGLAAALAALASDPPGRPAANSDGVPVRNPGNAAASDPAARPDAAAKPGPTASPAPIDPVRPGPASRTATPKVEPPGVQWGSLARQSLFFLGAQHAFRLATEYDTRNAGGPFVKNYLRSVGNLHGWADGDPFYVNYVGHPMQGAVSGFIWAQNDNNYKRVTFGRDPAYWRSRLRATAFSFVYSAQFEIGPISEATIGHIQKSYPQMGLVDIVVTPIIGAGWMVGEDAIDRLIIERLERRIQNSWGRLLLRGGLNPSRSFANLMAGRVPWHRDSRPGVGVLGPPKPMSILPDTPAPPPDGTVAPLDFSIHSQVRQFSNGLNCLGGGADLAVRTGENWQMVGNVSGCNLGMSGLRSGDALTFMAGPRWKPSAPGRLVPYFQVLAGGIRVTTETLLPERRDQLRLAQEKDPKLIVRRNDYTLKDDAAGFAIEAGGGVDLNLNRVLTFRLGNLGYTRAWMPKVDGRDYNQGLQFSAGLVLQVGTW